MAGEGDNYSVCRTCGEEWSKERREFWLTEYDGRWVRYFGSSRVIKDRGRQCINQIVAARLPPLLNHGLHAIDETAALPPTHWLICAQAGGTSRSAASCSRACCRY